MALCSYTWNRNRFHKKSTAMNVAMCVKSLICALFCNRKVQLSKVESIYNENNNCNTIFGKEYKTYKDRINQRKTEEQLNTEKKLNTEKQHIVEKQDNSTHQSTLKVQYISANEFNNLINNQTASDDIYYIVTEHLKLHQVSGSKEFKLPEHLMVIGHFDASCTGLTHLPEDCTITGSINLSRCPIKAIPESISTIGGSLYLTNCTALTKLPETMKAHISINFSGCTSLTTLPQHIITGDTLCLNGCINIKKLPKTMECSYVMSVNCPKINTQTLLMLTIDR